MVTQMTVLAEEARKTLSEFMQRGSEQRPTGTLSTEEKGKAKTEFKLPTKTTRNR